jgi:hypothetical protein
MINKDTYKRLTEKTKDCFQYDLKDFKHKIGEFNDYDAFFAYSMAVKRLGELEDKITDGTLVELPCKVGDTVYEVFKDHKPPFIKETTIEKIVITGKGFKLRLSRNSVYETAISSLGKTLFLSEVEAEAKLKELQEKEK